MLQSQVRSLASGLGGAEGLRKLSLHTVDLSGSGWSALLEGLRGGAVSVIK